MLAPKCRVGALPFLSSNLSRHNSHNSQPACRLRSVQSRKPFDGKEELSSVDWSLLMISFRLSMTASKYYLFGLFVAGLRLYGL